MRLVEKREIADMVNEDISKDREFRVDRSEFAEFGPERLAKAAEGRGGVQLGNLASDFPPDEFAFEVCRS